MTTPRRPLGRTLLALSLTFLTLSVFAVTQIGASRPASADELNGAITNVSVQQTTVGWWSNMRVDIDWAVPDSSVAGDTFTITLPPELSSLTNGFDLKAPDGSVVAHAVVVHGVVTFTLTDYADTHSDVAGTAFFEASWDHTDATPGADNTLVFHTSTQDFTDHVAAGVIGVVDRTKGRKYGYWVDRADQGTTNPTDALRWGLEAPQGPWDRLVFVDTVSAGHVVGCATVQVERITSFNSGGEALSSVALDPATYTVTCSPSGLTVTTGPVADGVVIRVSYATTITDTSVGSYKNAATITADGTDEAVSSNVIRSVQGGDGGGSTTTTSTSTSTSTTTSTVPETTTSTTVAETTPTTVAGSTTSTTSTPTAVDHGTATTTPGGQTHRTDRTRRSPTASTVTTLPRTGSNTGVPAVTGLALLVTGAALLLVSRRRSAPSA